MREISRNELRSGMCIMEFGHYNKDRWWIGIVNKDGRMVLISTNNKQDKTSINKIVPIFSKTTLYEINKNEIDNAIMVASI